MNSSRLPSENRHTQISKRNFFLKIQNRFNVSCSVSRGFAQKKFAFISTNNLTRGFSIRVSKILKVLERSSITPAKNNHIISIKDMRHWSTASGRREETGLTNPLLIKLVMPLLSTSSAKQKSKGERGSLCFASLRLTN